jgi:tetratricopeptide (TPR) repeat protein
MKGIFTGIALQLLLAIPTAYAASYCGDLTNNNGPYDYTNAEFTQALRTIEAANFSESMERLSENNIGTVGARLDQILRTFPNHHRALATLSRYALREKALRIPGTTWSVECYFERAVRFKANDAMVRMIYGGYLAKLKRLNDALEQLTEAIKLQPDSGTINYNLGLVYFEKKDYTNARLYAKKAYSLHFTLPALRNKLAEIGEWEAGPEDVAPQGNR